MPIAFSPVSSASRSPADGGREMAVITSIAILAGVFAPTLAFLVIALVSVKNTKPADRPAILRALAALLQRCAKTH